MQLIELNNAVLAEYKGKQIIIHDARRKRDHVIKGTIVRIIIVNKVVVVTIKQDGWATAPIENCLNGSTDWKFMHGNGTFDLSDEAHLGVRGFLTFKPSRNGTRAYIRC